MHWRVYCIEDTWRSVPQILAGVARDPYNNKVINETPQMSTRSRVGLELSDGSILSIYSHYDGYPEWAGRILCTHYNTREKVEALVDGGDVSCLWTDDGFYTSEGKTQRGYYGPLHYSERGEDCPPRLDADLCEYLFLMVAEEYPLHLP
jgi:hypothetical protein